MSSSSVVSLSSFNLLFFTQVLTVLTSSIKYHEYVTDKGKNISIPCNSEGNIMWVKENGNNSTIIQTGKFLVLTNVTTSDRGVYICFASVPPHNDSTTEYNTALEEGERNDEVAASAVDNKLSNANKNVPTAELESSSTSVSKINNNNITIASTTSPLPVLIVKTVATIAHNNTNASSSNITIERFEEQEYQAFQKVNLSVRTAPGPVTQLYFKASTILGFLIWRFNKTNSGGYPVRSFTAEFRNVSYNETPLNSSYEHAWSRMDPINIAPNVRQMEVYRLEPNTTYEFRIWANNQLGSGEVVTTNVTTLPETKEEDLIRLIQPDLDNFDPRVWIVAVSVVLGTLVILAIGLCIVLSKECYQASHMGYEDGWDSIELIPNIILNPGFCENDGQPYTRTIIFGGDDDTDSYESESDHEPRMEKFKRKVSVFFTGPTIKRI